MFLNFYLTWCSILVAVVYNTLLSYSEYNDFCLWNSEVHVIDGYYTRWPEKELKNCPYIPPIWFRTENGSYYSGDEGTLKTYVVLETTLYFDDTSAINGLDFITAYAFYPCDQIFEAIRLCSMNEDYCARYPTIICSDGNGTFSGCTEWNKMEDGFNGIGEPTYFNITSGQCPSYVTMSAPIPDNSNPDHTKSTGQSSGSSGKLRMEWTWALIAVSIIVFIVLIASIIHVCRKYNMDMRYNNRTVVADDNSDDDEIEPPKKKAPSVPMEIRSKHADHSKDGKEQLIPNVSANTQDFAIGKDSDGELSDDSV